MTLKKIYTSALSLSLSLSLSAYAATSTNKNAELSSLNKNIATIQVDLKKASLKKTHLQKTLSKIETTEGQVSQQLKNTQQHLSLNQQKIAQLKQQSAPLIAQNDQSHDALKAQIRAAYFLNQQPYLKLLLSPDDVSSSQRLLMYFHYVTAAQMQTITQLQQSISTYQENQQAIQHQYKKLLTLKETQLQNKAVLQKTKEQRQALIQTIDQNIQTKSQKLKLLLRDKKALENTVQQLNQQMTQQHLSAAVLGNKPFAQLRGKLSWPTQGHVQQNFGTQIDQSELRWDGTLINAQAGQAVHAIAAGKVIFAKWLEGYGLLVIINHGGGYMSLYGRNQSLSVTVGEHISPGEVIASVGESGGFHHTALYFSIRHNTKALNPAQWCR